MTEENIIKELKRGNSSVLKYVYVHLNAVHSFVIKNSGGMEDGNDIFQEAVIVFYKNSIKTDFILSSSIKTYLIAIARRLWLKKLRDEKQQYVSIADGVDLTLVDHFEFELPQPHKMNQSEEIQQALNQIGDTCQNILKLFYFNKLSLERIREKLDYSSVQVVRQQKYRCLKKIKGVIKSTILDQ
ncbi:MAG: sigma-70 family RNA polymerase sigma factor [Reichenbachiella sp.]